MPSKPFDVKLRSSNDEHSPLLSRFSLDGKLLALQMSAHVVNVYPGRLVGSGEDAHPCATDPWSLNVDFDNSSESSILSGGIIWSDHGGNSQDLLVVCNHGLDMYKVSTVRNQLAKVRGVGVGKAYTLFLFFCRTKQGKAKSRPPFLVCSLQSFLADALCIVYASTLNHPNERPPHPPHSSLLPGSPFPSSFLQVRSYLSLTHSFWYEPTTRCLMMCTGETGDDMRCYFLLKENNYITPRLELPPPDKVRKFTLEKGMGQPFVRNQDCSLVCLYGKCFCCDIHCSSGVMKLLHICSSTLKMEPFRSYALYSDGPITCSVVDSILVCHGGNAMTSFIYDVNSDINGTNAEDPICGGSTVNFESWVESNGEELREDMEALSAQSTDQRKGGLHCKELYDGRWSLLAPNKLLDPASRGTLWHINVNLRSVMEASYDSSLVIPFLMRRKGSGMLVRRICLKRLDVVLEERGEGISGWIECWAKAYGECSPLESADASDQGKKAISSMSTVNSAIKKFRRYSTEAAAGSPESTKSTKRQQQQQQQQQSLAFNTASPWSVESESRGRQM